MSKKRERATSTSRVRPFWNSRTILVLQLSSLLVLSIAFITYIDSRFRPVLSRLEQLEDLITSRPLRRETKIVAKRDANNHDRNSTFSYMWVNGRPLDRTHSYLPSMPGEANITLDSLSVGSAKNLDLIQAQVNTWGSHHSVRYFFAATEDDDDELTCQDFLNETTMVQISDHCHSRRHRNGYLQHSPVHKYWNNRYAYPPFLQTRGPGWICAQKRFAFAIRKLGWFYRRELEGKLHLNLPDYLLMQDDDTFYNTLLLEEYLSGKDSLSSFAEAGCLIRVPVDKFNFTFPWGGFGFVLSKAAIQQLIRPIRCSSVTPGDTFIQHVCNRLDDNFLGEKAAFQEGMSVSDLMGAHAEREPFSNFRHWNPGYCLHGDWVIGYYINYYHITEHVSDPIWKAEPELRIESTFGEFNGTKETKNCRNSDDRRCNRNKDAIFCHRQSVESMNTKFISHLAASGKFRS